MSRRVTVERHEPGADIDSHIEGIALLSCTGKCYGMPLQEIIEEVKPDVTDYGDSIELEPHTDCLDIAIDCTNEEHRMLIENSIWLVDCECFFNEEYHPQVKNLIKMSFPNRGNGLIWIDESRHSLTESEEQELKSISTKTKVVDDVDHLLEKIESYLEFSVNPYFGSGNIVEWYNEVHRIQKTIG